MYEEAEREVIGERTTGIGTGKGSVAYIVDSDNRDLTAPATDDARRWSGWGTALKPAHEPIVVARKPLSGTVAANVLAHGTGALNIDGCRVEFAPGDEGGVWGDHGQNPENHKTEPGSDGTTMGRGWHRPGSSRNDQGRWPPNVVLDEAAAAELDRQSGTSTSRKGSERASANAMWGRPNHVNNGSSEYDDVGGASRFFPTFRYEAKAPADERPRVNGTAHPTVKPLGLVRWLVRLVTPPGGLVLDPFAGSGTTGEACIIEGFQCVLIEREADYLPLIRARLDKPIQMTLGGGAA
jgi:site-specific DNA-methyltransferase (adenine-specific)